MASVQSVAAKVVDHFERPITTMKLQKLVYFAQAWSYALLKRPLFEEEFRAYARGPVCYELFDHHRGDYAVDKWEHGDASDLRPEEEVVVNAVLRNYGALSGLQLSEITHEPGTPWSRIRDENGIGQNQPSNLVIPKDYIRDSINVT